MITKNKFEMQTPFLPIEAFKPFKARLGILNETFGYKDFGPPFYNERIINPSYMRLK